MVPNSGEFVCYFPTGVTIEQPGVERSLVDEFNRYRSDTLRDVLQIVNQVQAGDIGEGPLISGIGYWGTEHDLNEPIEYGNDKYCRVFAPHLGHGFDVYERELITNVIAATDAGLSKPELPAAQIHDISLESVWLRPDLHMGISILFGVDQPQNAGSDMDDQNTPSEYMSKAGDWVVEHKDEILASLLSGSALQAAGYFMDDGRHTESADKDFKRE
ncbi:hypothetical protein [Halorubrum vacuolatum]|uniref:Uncharacterized protein n=1 Tax=Halorubrum vacuolatum TaxID=63740 RepID=A0A238XQE5_HALVU|nr:hypothetical protein [Halorubrum vacuolatum]SNR61256.1 hypothetical protein SAMN06264855_12146 [Halorubrum vacuolatum]